MFPFRPGNAPVNFRYEVMVVRIEPLGHFQCRDIQCGITARETEIPCGIRGVPAGNKTGGHGPKHAGHVQHSVIQGKIPGGHIAEPGITLHLPVTLFQFRAGVGQTFSRKSSFPERFESCFQLPVFPDGRETKNVGFQEMLLSKVLKGQSHFTFAGNGQ